MNQIVMWVEAYIILVLSISLAEDIYQYVRKMRHSICFLKLQSSVILMILFDALNLFLLTKSETGFAVNSILLQMTDSITFLFYYITLYYFVCYVKEHIENSGIEVPIIYTRIAWVICAIYAALWMLTPFTGWIMRTVDGVLEYGHLYIVGQLGGYLMVVLSAVMMTVHRRAFIRRNLILLMSFITFPLIGVVLRSIFHIPSLVMLAMSVSIVLLHVSVFREGMDMFREQELEMANARVRVMLSQIHPHFLYNTLNAIYVLCEKDPEMAQEAVSEFSEYLRANFESLENDARIPIEREMEHVDHYLRLEKMRFRDELKVEKNLQALNFTIPALTIEPLVENAVNHGIGRKKGGGTVRISTREEEKAFVVTVKDDGIGFDMKGMNADDLSIGFVGPEREKVHIGLKNVQDRIRAICGGSYDVESEVGKGTRVTLRIPK